MATCDACGTEVESDALIDSDGRRLCTECEFDADFGGGVGGGLLPVILGGIAAALPECHPLRRVLMIPRIYRNGPVTGRAPGRCRRSPEFCTEIERPRT